MVAVGASSWSSARILEFLFVGVDHGQQRRSYQHSPERPHDSERNWNDDRCPDRHLRGPPHDVGLKQKAIDDGDAGIKSQHT